MCFTGDNSGKVVVWNMGPVREEKYEKDENVPKLLCQMENHLCMYFFIYNDKISWIEL